MIMTAVLNILKKKVAGISNQIVHIGRDGKCKT